MQTTRITNGIYVVQLDADNYKQLAIVSDCFFNSMLHRGLQEATRRGLLELYNETNQSLREAQNEAEKETTSERRNESG